MLKVRVGQQNAFEDLNVQDNVIVPYPGAVANWQRWSWRRSCPCLVGGLCVLQSLDQQLRKIPISEMVFRVASLVLRGHSWTLPGSKQMPGIMWMVCPLLQAEKHTYTRPC